MIATNLRKQETLDANLKAIQQTDFTANLGKKAKMFFIIEEAKENISGLSQGAVGVL